ncbi:hypothetical protein D3C72_1365860 [compost metagenome]
MAGHSFGEDWGLFKLEAYIQADNHQCSAEQERYAPAPVAELLIAEQHGQGQEQAIGSEKTDRRAQLREHAEPGAFALGGVFGGQQRRAAPFTAKAKALAETEHAEQDWCPGADTVIAR